MGKKPPGKDRKRAIALAVVKWSMALAATFSLAAGAGFAAAVGVYSSDLPSTSELRENYRPKQVNRFMAVDGSLIGVTYSERRSVVPMTRVPPIVVKAVLGAEDADFFEHQGLDYPGILRALWVNVRSGRKAQGASTITQQVVRTFYLGREKTFSRKFKELLLSRRLEQNLSKEEILFLYLNQIYFGHGRYGIGEASRYYFGKEVDELGLAEAALLAGLPKGPEIFSPFKNLDKCTKRRALVLDMMVKHALITREEAEAAKLAPMPTEPGSSYDGQVGAEFVAYAQKTLIAMVGKEAADQGGYQITTTMDVRTQQAAREALDDGLGELDNRRGYVGPIKPRGKKGAKSCREWPPGVKLEDGKAPVGGKIYKATIVDTDDELGKVLVELGDTRGVIDLANEPRYNPKKLSASEFAHTGCAARVSLKVGVSSFGDEKLPRFRLELGPQAVIIAIDPATHEVRAMIGGQGYVRGGFNRALKAQRQPGSSFKPFVYLEALRSRKFTAASIVEDAPVRYDEYKPENYETWKFAGPVRLRKALARSINVVAVRLIDRVDPKNVVTLARKLGIRSELDPVLGLALGGSGVRPVDLANAYATIAASGMSGDPIIVKSVVDPLGKSLPIRRGRPGGRVVTEAEAWLVTSMLGDVINDAQGTAKSAKKLKRPAAGKTGTSNKARDAWFAGFTPQLAAVVWVGFDDYKSLGKKESGGRSAVPIWTQFMRDALQGKKKLDFGPPPDGIDIAIIDPVTGLLAWEGQPDAIEEYFLAGTVPTEQAFSPDMVTPEDFMMTEGLDGFAEEPPVDSPEAPPTADDAPPPTDVVPPAEVPAPDPPAPTPTPATSPSPPPEHAATPAPASP